MITKTLASIYKTNLGVKKNEKVLVFTDRISSSELPTGNELCRRERLRDIALLAAEIGKAFTKKIFYLEYSATGSHGVEPPEALWESAFGEKAIGELKKYRLLNPLLNKRIDDAGIERAETIITGFVIFFISNDLIYVG